MKRIGRLAAVCLLLLATTYADNLADARKAEAAGDYAAAFGLYQRMAEQGNLHAQVRVGYAYYYGRGTIQDYKETIRWFAKAVQQGQSDPDSNYACYAIGLMIQNGQGIGQNDSQAVKWFEIAAERGDPQGQFRLGLMYAAGLGVQRDQVQALRWLLASAAQNNMEAFAAAKELKEAMSRTQIAEAEKLAEPWVSRRTRPIVPSEATSQAKELMKVLTSALTRNSGELDPLSGGLSIVESKPLPSPETDPIVQRLRPSVERGSTQAKPARLIAEEAFQSVALLMMLDQSNQPVSLGSGFALGNGLIATNYHVISGASAGYVKVVGKSAKYDIRGTVALDTEHDLAIISVPDLRCPALAIADSGQAATGDEVYAVGNPQGLEGTFSQGIISAIRHIGQDSLLQITAPISPGSSGGPVLDKSGAVVGIAVATFNGGQNLNLAIPSAYLEDLRRKVSPDPRPLSSITAAASGRSVATLLGGPSLQGVVGENLTWTCGLFFYCGSYSFSLRNELRDAVQEIYGLAVFLDQNNKPIDVDVIRYAGVIPGGLAKRLTSQVDQSVQRLTKSAQFRILDFRLAQQ